MIEIDGVNVEEAAIVRPGDTLVVRVGKKADPRQIAEFADRLRERLPQGVETVVLACEEIAVARPDADA